MDTFQLLSKGGAKFNKKRFQSDVQLFTVQQPSKNVDKGKKPEIVADELPQELDFFRYAKGSSGHKNETTDELDDAESSREKRRKLNACEPSNSPRQRVVCKGRDVPEPTESFEELRQRYTVSSLILQNLEKNGWNSPTGIQAYGIPILMEASDHLDIAAISPTGTGKTLAYLLSIIARLGAPISQLQLPEAGNGVRALILAPTRELAHQIYNECLKICEGRKWRITLYSKATAATLADKSVRDKVDIVISTPMRLVASLKEGKIELDNVRHLVLDEADRMLDAEFLPQVQEIVDSCSHTSIQKAIFSATLPAGAEQVAMNMLTNPIRVVVGLKDTPLPLIRQSLVYVADEASKLPSLISYLTSTCTTPASPHDPPPWAPPILIFASSQPRAASLHASLLLHSVPNVFLLHAALSNAQRLDVVRRMRAGECWVLVCTEVVARGMDFKGIRGVINYDWPGSVQSYVHRIGRTGRAGREGFAVTYWTNEDAPFLKTIANVLLQSGSPVPDWILKLPKPSQLLRQQMRKIRREDDVDTAGRIGRSDARKKRDMILGSKRRKEKIVKEEWKGFGEA
ncbi:P-loop containing nucleoside triphosphate hydrolase protein [Hysterangium stoloniferum]|nr:P-loop containing nucleoside triphosphate hydrolase protein [Hysterangium stoloniferum]